MTVLVLGRDLDPQVDRVVDELGRRRASVFRTDLAAFPAPLTVSATLGPSGWVGTLADDRRTLDLGDVTAIWYRHPSHFTLPERLSRPERRHASAEARAGVAGILNSLDAFWVNHPSREAAMFKPRQLDVARRSGLRVPPTLVTNRPGDVGGFADHLDGADLAVKNLTAASLVESGRVQVAYTRRLATSGPIDTRGVDTTAHLFQQFIGDKEFEVRLTCVGERMFGAAIHASSARAEIDFRADYDALRYRAVDPPDDVRAGVRRFMDAFGIHFGAFDFAVRENGEWILFECNPFGQYGWLEDELDLPISAALADLLCAGGR